MKKLNRHLVREVLQTEKPQFFGEQRNFEIKPGMRIDVGVTEALDKSRSFVQNLISEGHVLVNGEIKKANYKIRLGDQVQVEIPEPRLLEVLPEDIPLDIVFEDEDLIVVNKVQGMVVHPAPGAWTGTLVNALMYHCDNLSGINGVLRPGIVHRIDKDTSGLLVIAKSDLAHEKLSEQLKEHSTARKYRAIVHGILQEPGGTVNAPIGRDPSERKRMAVTSQNSKRAVTHYTILENFREFSNVEVQLETGRTHQIRVHMAYIRHPVLGDPLYGPKQNRFNLNGQMLHAVELGFVHPRNGNWLQFSAPLPEKFIEILGKLSLL
ncbi:MAG: RluA family pseudouridine synthase [Desulfitobacteriaceae bacterium]